MKYQRPPIAALTLLLFATALLPIVAIGQDSSNDTAIAAGLKVEERILKLTPASRPKSVGEYEFFPSEDRRLDGNAATIYLKAAGYLDYWAALNHVQNFSRRQIDRSERESRPLSDYPWMSWLKAPPEQLLNAETEEFLSYTSFQSRLIAEAKHFKHYAIARRVAPEESWTGVRLPEVSSMREMARYETIRLRRAIAQQDYETAVDLLGGIYSMANHMSQDDFIVVQLVGSALVKISSDTAMLLAEQPGSPNLYWAYAMLPCPITDPATATRTEARLLRQEWDFLFEFDTRVKPPEYWRQFLDRIASRAPYYTGDGFTHDIASDPQHARLQIAETIAAVYPDCVVYLTGQGVLEAEQVDAYPTAQIVFLTVQHLLSRRIERNLAIANVPYHQVKQLELSESAEELSKSIESRIGFIGGFSRMLDTPMFALSPTAETHIALLQTVHALRAHLAEHDGQLPGTLAELKLPAPDNPMTGQPFEYHHVDGQATLQTQIDDQTVLRLVIEPAAPSAATR